MSTDIAEMRAGRETDALVAEKFYGWRREKIGNDYDGKHGGAEVLVPPTITDITPHLPLRGEVPLSYFAPNYSKDNEHAITLINDMQARGFYVCINTTCDRGLFDMQVFDQHMTSLAVEVFQPLPLAACRCALKVASAQKG
jgi:hypothetical protein